MKLQQFTQKREVKSLDFYKTIKTKEDFKKEKILTARFATNYIVNFGYDEKCI
jgi:hypothetical protein